MFPSRSRVVTVAIYLAVLSPAAATQVVTGSVASGIGLLPKFGHAVDLRGDVMIVGAPGDSAGATVSVGSAIIFRRINGSWVEEARLQPADAAQFDLFGNSVSIDGSLCAIGAPAHDAKGSNAGAVYIYRRGAVLWSLEAKLFAETPQANASFGEALDLDGTTLAVGEKNYDLSASLRDAGAVGLFSYNGASWVTNQTLVDPAPGGTNAFGDAVCLRGNQLAVGAPNTDTTVVDAGRVLVFKRVDSASPWTFAQSLANPFPEARDYFGTDVAIDDDWLLAGASGDNTAAATDSGSAFAFQRLPVTETWVHLATLIPPDLTANCGFGTAVAMSGNRGVVGAPYDDAYGLNSGAGYCYIRARGAWYLNEKLLSDQVISYPTMGWSAALHDGTTVLGAWQANQPAGSGAATLFECAPTPVVLIPGMAGSAMAKNGVEYWPAVTPSTIASLNLRTGIPGIEAVDVVRYVVVIPPDIYTVPIYGPLIDFMTNDMGYTEYDFQGVPNPFTSDYLVTNQFERRPDLFVFPYDWRRSNAAHSPTLNAYIGRIRELHEGRKVNVIAHSMGGLVFRRYVLDHTSNAETSVAHVATVGSPIWGAPIGIYRLITGAFFDQLQMDGMNASAMRDLLFSIQGMHELLPTTHYFSNGGSPVVREGGADENGNGHSDDAYDRAAVIAYVTAQRNRFGYQDAPYPNNILFHDSDGARQDDWSLDSGAIRYRHVIGTGGRTTTQIVLRTTAYLGGPFPTIPIGSSFHTILDREYGAGDETVPALSARRAPAGQSSPFWAPDTVDPYEVAAAADAGHNIMLLRPHVWNAIFSFFSGINVLSPPPAPALAQGSGFLRVAVYGVGFVDVFDDAGHTNTLVSSVAALPVPGVSPIYGGDELWCSLDIEEGRQLWIQGRFTNQSATGVIEVVRRNETNLPVALYRYLLTATSGPWRVAITSPVPETARDSNQNGVFESTEIIAPSHQAASAGGVDATAPRLGATLAATSSNLLLTLSGADGPTGGLVSIFYATGTVAMTAYTAPLSFPINQQISLAGFAEDALGNRSGWLALVLNPTVQISKTNDGMTLTWPLSDGYTLEQAPDPRGPWAATDTVTVPNALSRMAVLAATNKLVYRLRFTGLSL